MTVTPQWFNVIVTFVPGLFICLFKQTFFALSRHVTLFWESRSFIPAHLPLGHVLNHFSLYHLKQIRASSQIVLVDTLKDERKKNLQFCVILSPKLRIIFSSVRSLSVIK